MTRGGYPVRIPDAAYYREVVRCGSACPVGTDAAGYVDTIARGDFERAYWIARERNPLASTCGRICGAHCEAQCRRGRHDAPAALRALKRFVAERYGVESAGYAARAAGRFARAAPTGRRVAIAGSGPAGLAAAHDLARAGHVVEIFEAESVAGGMMALGIPPYRLSRELLAAEIDFILSLGVTLHLDSPIGPGRTLRDLRAQGFEALLLATGLPRSRRLDLPGVDLPGVGWGVDFLRAANLRQHPVVGLCVVVVGGGNVAADVARTALRLGAREVTLVCLETRAEMPASALEVEELEEEGIDILPSWGPHQVIAEDGRAGALELVRCTAVFDAVGRFAPRFDERTRRTVAADTVLFAIGQAADLSFLDDADGVRTTPRGLDGMDPLTGATSAPDVFAAGDLAHGPRLLIDAVAGGQRAARAIHERLTGAAYRVTTEVTAHRVPFRELPRFRPHDARCEPPRAPAAARVALLDAPVEQGYAEHVARFQADRCLRCHLNTVFIGARCMLCGGCVNVCPEACLKLVPAAAVRPTPELETLVQRGWQTTLRAAGRDGLTFMLKDEERCLRCGLCARRCPADALHMERVTVKERVSYERRSAG